MMNSKQIRNRILKSTNQVENENSFNKEYIHNERTYNYKQSQYCNKNSLKQSPIAKQNQQIKVEDCKHMLEDSLNSIQNLLKIIKNDESTKTQQDNLYESIRLQIDGTFYLSPGKLSTIKQQGQQDQIIETQKKKSLSRSKSGLFQKFDSRYSTIPRNDQDELLISEENSLFLRHEGKFQNQVKQWSEFRKKVDDEYLNAGQEVLDQTHQQLANSRQAVLQKIRINRKKTIPIILTSKRTNGSFKSVKAKLHYACPKQLFDRVCALLKDEGIYISIQGEEIKQNNQTCQIPETKSKKGLNVTKRLTKSLAFKN